MHPLGVVVGVGQKRPDPRPPRRLLQRRLELHQVRSRPPAGSRREHHRGVTIGHQHDLGVLRVSRFLRPTPGLRPPLHVVSADVPRFQPGAVDGGRRDPPFPDLLAEGPCEHGVEHRPARLGREEAGGGLLEGGEVGDDLQADEAGRVGMVGEVVGQAAIVEPRELLEDQAGQELVLGELLGAELVPVRGEGPASRVVGDLEDPSWRLARGHAYTTSRAGQRFSTEHRPPGW